jgi:hypothetical protein
MVENAKFETQLKIPGLHIASQRVKNCSGLLAGYFTFMGVGAWKKMAQTFFLARSSQPVKFSGALQVPKRTV